MKVRQALGKFREVFQLKKMQKRCLSQLGIEEEFVQLSRQLLKILCGGQPSIGEAKLGKKNAKIAAYLNQVQKKNQGHVRQEKQENVFNAKLCLFKFGTD